jgi:Phospholipase_D-nuclease N-terminal
MDSSETRMANMEESSPQPAEDMRPGRHRKGAPRKKWKDFSRARRARMVVQAAIQIALAAWALWDIRHRPANKIKGSKRWWTLAAFVQPVGPIAYLLFGRKS